MPRWPIKLVTMKKNYVTQGKCAHGMCLWALCYSITGIVKWNQLSEMSSITNAFKWSYFDSTYVLPTCGKNWRQVQTWVHKDADHQFCPALSPTVHLQPALPFLSEWGSLEPRGHAYPVLLPLDHTPGAQVLGKALSSQVHLPRASWATGVLSPGLKGWLFAGSVDRIWTCGHRKPLFV